MEQADEAQAKQRKQQVKAEGATKAIQRMFRENPFCYASSVHSRSATFILISDFVFSQVADAELGVTQGRNRHNFVSFAISLYCFVCLYSVQPCGFSFALFTFIVAGAL